MSYIGARGINCQLLARFVASGGFLLPDDYNGPRARPGQKLVEEVVVLNRGHIGVMKGV